MAQKTSTRVTFQFIEFLSQWRKNVCLYCLQRVIQADSIVVARAGAHVTFCDVRERFKISSHEIVRYNVAKSTC